MESLSIASDPFDTSLGGIIKRAASGLFRALDRI